MARAKNFKQAAQMSLNDRWYKIVNAKTYEEMNKIFSTTDCGLCTFCASNGIFCSACPMKDKRYICCGAYQTWAKAINKNDFPEAFKAAQGVVKRLEVIAHDAD